MSNTITLHRVLRCSPVRAFNAFATAVELKEVICGTELRVTQEGIPEVIPAEMCYLGWQESLIQLAQLAEPKILQ